MSDARYDRLVALAKKADSTFVLTPETDAILRAVAVELEVGTSRSDVGVWAGMLMGQLMGGYGDYGTKFEALSEHVMGTGLGLCPSLNGIEFTLVRLKEKFDKGWRLVPPPEESAE